MDRNDKVLLGAFVIALGSIVATAFAPTNSTSLGSHFWQFANSAITLTIIGTFVAAFAGTWGAVVLGERALQRRERMAELRAVNSALGHCFVITNTALLAKQDRIKPMADRYREEAATFERYAQSLKIPNRPRTPIPFDRLQMTVLSTPHFPMAQLEKVFSDKINSGAAAVLLIKLAESISGLIEILDRRNRWIETAKTEPVFSGEELQYAYFGLPSPAGMLDKSYSGFINSLSIQIEHTIAFSILLAESLTRRGQKLLDDLGMNSLTLVSANFKAAHGLLPDMKEYAGWTPVESDDGKTFIIGHKPKSEG